MSKHLHIICFDNPYPPSYGGAIDVFYRIQTLAKEGVHITLHCFYKGEEHRSQELERICEKVYYYPRKKGLLPHCSFVPYTVASRTHEQLLPRLLSDNYPILFEGLVSCALMNHPSLQSRKKYFRECNVEHDYYRALGDASTNLWKKLFYYIESIRLKRFERCLNQATEIWALAHQDEAYFRKAYPKVRTRYVACFHGNTELRAMTGIGNPYILYHGNLAVEENEKAANYIIREIAPAVCLPVIITGKSPSRELTNAATYATNVQLIPNPTTEELNTLIREAQLHLLVTFQATGIKLKLLNVLYNGRHVIVNPPMVEGTDYEPLCHVGSNAEEIIVLCNQFAQEPFTENDIELRKKLLQQQSIKDIINNL